MQVETIHGTTLALVPATGPTLGREQDALDLIGATYGTGADMLVVPVERFDADFFRLANRKAGLFLQKLQNYQMRLAVVGDLRAALAESTALRDFIVETNRHGFHRFARDMDELRTALAPRG